MWATPHLMEPCGSLQPWMPMSAACLDVGLCIWIWGNICEYIGGAQRTHMSTQGVRLGRDTNTHNCIGACMCVQTWVVWQRVCTSHAYATWVLPVCMAVASA